MLYFEDNVPERTIATTIDSDDTALVLDDASGMPDVPFPLALSTDTSTVEWVRVTAVNEGTDTLTIVRGQYATTAAGHASGKKVRHGIPAVVAAQAEAVPYFQPGYRYVQIRSYTENLQISNERTRVFDWVNYRRLVNPLFGIQITTAGTGTGLFVIVLYDAITLKLLHTVDISSAALSTGFAEGAISGVLTPGPYLLGIHASGSWSVVPTVRSGNNWNGSQYGPITGGGNDNIAAFQQNSVTSGPVDPFVIDQMENSTPAVYLKPA